MLTFPDKEAETTMHWMDRKLNLRSSVRKLKISKRREERSLEIIGSSKDSFSLHLQDHLVGALRQTGRVLFVHSKLHESSHKMFKKL